MSLSEHEAEFHAPQRSTPQPPPSAPVEKAEPPEPVVASTADVDDEAREAQQEAEAIARDPNLRFKEPEPERHRARSQQAKPEDVPQIKALTAELRAKEADLAKAKPGQADSPRIVALRRQIRGIEAELADLQPKPVVPVSPVAPKPASEPTPVFTKPKPTIQSLMDAGSTDPYGEIADKIDEWREEKRTAEAAAAQQVSSAQADAAKFTQRAVAFAATHPDYDTLINTHMTAGRELSDLMGTAIRTADNGPELLYALLQQPDEFDRLWLATSTTPVSESGLVAMRRHLALLASRTSAGTTGAATPPRPEPRAPRPPTPVRTGPLTTGTEPPDDGASLAAHEQFYSKGRRRR